MTLLCPIECETWGRTELVSDENGFDSRLLHLGVIYEANWRQPMKKAKEYAAEFEADPTRETLRGIAHAFMVEVKEIIATRNARSNSALLSILDEQDRKWRAFARRIEGVRPDGFERLVKEVFPEVHVVWRGPHAPEVAGRSVSRQKV